MTCGQFPGWLCLPDTPPTFFPLPVPPPTATRSPPLSAVSRHPHIQSWIVISSLLSLSLSCLGHKLPLSSDFSHPFRCLDQPRLTRDGQTSPITSSNPISDLQIPAPSSTSILLCPPPLTRLAFHLTSHHLSPLPFRVPRTRPVFYAHVPCASHTLGLSPPPLSCHALYPWNGYAGQIQSWSPRQNPFRCTC
jgi:hypothetical protein